MEGPYWVRLREYVVSLCCAPDTELPGTCRMGGHGQKGGHFIKPDGDPLFGYGPLLGRSWGVECPAHETLSDPFHASSLIRYDVA